MTGSPPNDASPPGEGTGASVRDKMDRVIRAWATTQAGVDIRRGPVPLWLVEQFWLAQRKLVGGEDAPALPWEPLPTTEAARIKVRAGAAGIDVCERAPVPRAVRLLYGRTEDACGN